MVRAVGGKSLQLGREKSGVLGGAPPVSPSPEDLQCMSEMKN